MVSFTNISSILAVAILATSVSAGTLQAFSGNTCDGSAGNVVQCDLNCHQFYGRHSVRTTQDDSIFYFTNTGCTGSSTYVIGNGGCQNVNTGGPVLSFKCGGETGKRDINNETE